MVNKVEVDGDFYRYYLLGNNFKKNLIISSVYSLGKYKMCRKVTMETRVGIKYTCSSICDVTTGGTS